MSNPDELINAIASSEWSRGIAAGIDIASNIVRGVAGKAFAAGKDDIAIALREAAAQVDSYTKGVVLNTDERDIAIRHIREAFDRISYAADTKSYEEETLAIVLNDMRNRGWTVDSVPPVDYPRHCDYEEMREVTTLESDTRQRGRRVFRCKTCPYTEIWNDDGTREYGIVPYDIFRRFEDAINGGRGDGVPMHHDRPMLDVTGSNSSRSGRRIYACREPGCSYVEVRNSDGTPGEPDHADRSCAYASKIGQT